MLVIRRRAGESVLIGEDVEITVIECSATRVKLGIAAPAAVAILRKEIQLAASQNVAAAEAVSPESVASFLESIRKKPGASGTGAA